MKDINVKKAVHDSETGAINVDFIAIDDDGREFPYSITFGRKHFLVEHPDGTVTALDDVERMNKLKQLLRDLSEQHVAKVKRKEKEKKDKREGVVKASEVVLEVVDVLDKKVK